jgi:hypothetical protein
MTHTIDGAIALKTNRRIHMMMQLTGGRANFLIDENVKDIALNIQDSPLFGFRSALQRPDIRRAQLAALLRRALKGQKTQKEQKTYWSSFIAGTIGKQANSNEQNI